MKIQSISEQSRVVKTSGDNNFTNQVDVSLYVRFSEAEKLTYDYDVINQKVRVDFRIDSDWRSWGLKGATVSIVAIQPITVEITQWDEATLDDKPVKTLEVLIDPSQIKQDKFDGPISAVTVGDLEITIDINGIVNYEESSITVYEI
jgi:hypothetical protein